MADKIKKVAAIHDLAGLGRCSLTAAIPILSVLGVQPCPLPTAILSCQTDYEEFYFYDLTNNMSDYKKSWDKLNFKFEGIYSGFLGSNDQINLVIELIKKHKEALVVIDPVMGDNGLIYKTYTEDMCISMKELVRYADVVTPNLTECCILTNRDYSKVNTSNEELLIIAKEIANLGPKMIVITGVIDGNKVKTFAYDSLNNSFFIDVKSYNGQSYSGTGDIFASIVCGMLVKGFSLVDSVNKACDFIKKAIDFTGDENVDRKNGIYFEPYLKELFI